MAQAGYNKWELPLHDHYKMNVACFSPSCALTRVGILIRDFNGVVVAAFCTSIWENGDVSQVTSHMLMLKLFLWDSNFL